MSKWKRSRVVRMEYEAVMSRIRASAERHQQHTGATSADNDDCACASAIDCPCSANEPTTSTSVVDSTTTTDEPDGSDTDQSPVRCAELACPAGADADTEMQDATTDLAALAARHNLTHACVNDIAGLLRQHGINVPKDARTIMGTQRKAPTTGDGTFVHFGLRKGILDSLRSGPIPNEIRIQAHVDGIPLYKSSGTALWPILCRLTSVDHTTPFIVSLYCGDGKPPDVKGFLKQFIDELKELTEDGLFFKGTKLRVTITAIICDAPARSYVNSTIRAQWL